MQELKWDFIFLKPIFFPQPIPKLNFKQDLFATGIKTCGTADTGFCGSTLVGSSTVIPPFQELTDKQTDRHAYRTGGASCR